MLIDPSNDSSGGFLLGWIAEIAGDAAERLSDGIEAADVDGRSRRRIGETAEDGKGLGRKLGKDAIGLKLMLRRLGKIANVGAGIFRAGLACCIVTGTRRGLQLAAVGTGACPRRSDISAPGTARAPARIAGDIGENMVAKSKARFCPSGLAGSRRPA